MGIFSHFLLKKALFCQNLFRNQSARSKKYILMSTLRTSPCGAKNRVVLVQWTTFPPFP